jgi:hypothetical protein
MNHRQIPTLLGMLALVAGCDFVVPQRAAPYVVPWLAPILRGDTVRYYTCVKWDICEKPYDTQVPAKWSIPDSSVAALVFESSTTLVPNAGSILVRGVAAGTATLSVTHPDGGRVNTKPIFVGDSSDITRLEVSGLGPDSMRVTSQSLVTVMFWDSKGMWYRASPTAWSVSDTTVLKLTPYPNDFGRFMLFVQPLKTGTVSVVFTFLDVTVTQSLRVVP